MILKKGGIIMQSFVCTIVGMRYRDVSENDLSESNINRGYLICENDNRHDSNAIAFYIDNKKIGFVSKDDNQAVRECFKKSLKYKVSLMKRYPKALKLRFQIPHENRPSFDPTSSLNIKTGLTGIYSLTFICDNEPVVYIGQSTDILNRVHTHCRDLHVHKHDNQILQEHWNKGDNLKVEVLTTITKFNTLLERQISLGLQEIKYIKKYRKYYISANKETGGFVIKNEIFSNFVSTHHQLVRKIKDSQDTSAKADLLIAISFREEINKRIHKFNHFENFPVKHTQYIDLLKKYNCYHLLISSSNKEINTIVSVPVDKTNQQENSTHISQAKAQFTPKRNISSGTKDDLICIHPGCKNIVLFNCEAYDKCEQHFTLLYSKKTLEKLKSLYNSEEKSNS